jgi:hypothetical protein
VATSLTRPWKKSKFCRNRIIPKNFGRSFPDVIPPDFFLKCRVLKNKPHSADDLKIILANAITEIFPAMLTAAFANAA